MFFFARGKWGKRQVHHIVGFEQDFQEVEQARMYMYYIYIYVYVCVYIHMAANQKGGVCNRLRRPFRDIGL